jgi:hypothetical protein
MFEEQQEVTLAPAGAKQVPSYLLDDGELEGISGKKAVAL